MLVFLSFCDLISKEPDAWFKWSSDRDSESSARSAYGLRSPKLASYSFIEKFLTVTITTSVYFKIQVRSNFLEKLKSIPDYLRSISWKPLLKSP